eukprot:scaffold1888_cov120-Cylindrotheca_fusiformis.AAC.18
MTKSGGSLIARLTATLLLLLFAAGSSNASTVSKDAERQFLNLKTRGETFLKKPTVPGFNEKTSILSKIPTNKDATFSHIKVSKFTAVCCSMLLASTAGVMNGACLSGLVSGAKQATTAVTGSLTNSATGIPSGNTAQFVVGTKCILSYMGGSAIAGFLVPRPVAFELQNPLNVAFALTCAAGLLIASSMQAGAGISSYLWLSLAASGIQNSLTSVLTANLCRTAHFSGTTSDIGTLFGQVLRGNFDSLPKLKVLCLLFASFWAGGYASIPLGKALSHNTFLIAACIYMAMATSILFSSSIGSKTNRKLA